VESFGESGSVKITANDEESLIQIKISDNGKGISSEFLKRVGIRGETAGKEGGSGLGLFHAFETLKRWNGSLDIQSQVGSGTCVTLSIPKANAPSWFVSDLKPPANSIVVVVDDDESIHRVWRSKFENAELMTKGIRLQHFSTPNSLREYLTSKPNDSNPISYFLFDYELLGFKDTGLDLIQELNLADKSILVTSRFEEANVLEKCGHLGVRLIPKGIAGFVPISVGRLKKCPDAVLIDDDPLVRMTWSMSARDNDKAVLVYEDTSDYLTSLTQIDHSTPIYVDSNLSDGLKGEFIAKKIYDQGFKNIFIATGYSQNHFEKMPWIKEPPWLTNQLINQL
jgi:FixJ family two-component response regulator